MAIGAPGSSCRIAESRSESSRGSVMCGGSWPADMPLPSSRRRIERLRVRLCLSRLDARHRGMIVVPRRHEHVSPRLRVAYDACARTGGVGRILESAQEIAAHGSGLEARRLGGGGCPTSIMSDRVSSFDSVCAAARSLIASVERDWAYRVAV